jgi:hypothetical protein
MEHLYVYYMLQILTLSFEGLLSVLCFVTSLILFKQMPVLYKKKLANCATSHFKIYNPCYVH